MSKFDYTYDSEGEIQSWTQQTNSLPSSVYNLQYDAASQLVEALQSGAAVMTNEYAYDAAGNRLSERTNSVVEGATYNNVNELTNRSNGGSMGFRGSVNEPISNATVAGNAAALDSGTNFTGYATVSSGINAVQVQVSDYNGNTVANYYQVILTSGSSQTLTYDLNGNLVTVTNTTTGASISNVWDAANRLVAIYSNGTYASVFTYDGMGRRVRQTETTNSVTKSDNWMLWCGTQLGEKQDSTGGVVSNRFFAQGEQITGTNYFFNRDHLGSIREMVDGSGNIQARYTYDPWGRRTKVSGNLDADFGFTGHYYHAPSGLYLALYRAYSADLGRWLSRDPLYDTGRPDLKFVISRSSILALLDGPNETIYVRNDPVKLTDPSGLVTADECESQYEQDVKVCVGLKSAAQRAACYAKAMEFYAACLAEASACALANYCKKNPAVCAGGAIVIIIGSGGGAILAF